MLFHSSRQVSSLLSPTARATTCLVFLHNAIHIQDLFAFFKTNDHNSSNSNIVAVGSFTSGLTSVSLNGGNSSAFFLAILPPYSVRHQMFAQFLLSYFALDRHAVSLPFFLLNIHDVLDFLYYAACTPGRSIFAFHWVHARYELISHFHNKDTKG